MMMMRLEDLSDWLSNKDLDQQIYFHELLLSEMTTMNRALLNDDHTNNESKLEALEWSNELSHRILNILFELKRNEVEAFNDKLEKNILFYAQQSPDLAGHLGTIIKSTVDRFLYLNNQEDI